MKLFNEGDTACLMLNYQLNGQPLEEGKYEEIEFQINQQGLLSSIKKLLSKGEIEWATVTYIEDNIEKTFTGYVTYLSQTDTFKMQDGIAMCQIRILVNGEVGSSEFSQIDLGKALSMKVLE